MWMLLLRNVHVQGSGGGPCPLSPVVTREAEAAVMTITQALKVDRHVNHFSRQEGRYITSSSLPRI